jgi:hypothetical protein
VNVCAARTAGVLLFCASTLAAKAADAPAYEDRLIDGGNLPVDMSISRESRRDTSGWPRNFRVEAMTSRVTRDDMDSDETGVRLNGMLDTPNYGAFSLDANLRSAQGAGYGSGNVVTIYQLGLPMDGGWRVNNALGVSNTPAVDLARSQYRFFVPVILNNGAATEWRSPGDWQMHASIGQPGLLTGIYVPTFEQLGGQQVSAGAQWNSESLWSVGVQAIDIDGTRLGLGALGSSQEVSGQSWLGAVGWGTRDAGIQLNVVDSNPDDRSNQAGTWLDAAIRSGRTRHTFGVFHFEPDLLWGNQPLPSNLEGGYYRAAFQSRRWILDGGVDYTTPVSDGGDSTVFTTGYARYQWSSWLGTGGGFNVSQSETDAWSAFGFVDNTNRLGIGRAQVDYATDDVRDSTQLTLNQTWNTPPSTRFGSSIILGREELPDFSANTFGIALNGGGDLRSNLSLDLNARWDTSDGPASSDNILGSIAANWAFAPGWSAGANYYVSRNTWRSPFAVTSPIDELPEDRRTDDEGFYISLRYQWQAGTRTAPLAGAPGVGSGSVNGILYLDDNENGRMDAGEAGAPNVVILLNGRFASRTNGEGRFEFPAVAAGEHVLTVVKDNLPLPWIVPDEGRVSITVGVRDRTFVTVGAQRQR